MSSNLHMSDIRDLPNFRQKPSSAVLASLTCDRFAASKGRIASVAVDSLDGPCFESLHWPFFEFLSGPCFVDCAETGECETSGSPAAKSRPFRLTISVLLYTPQTPTSKIAAHQAVLGWKLTCARVSEGSGARRRRFADNSP